MKSSWMRVNRLQVNPSKTELLWCASGGRQHQIPTLPVRIGSTYVLPVSSVRDLGVHIDSDISLRTHVTATVRSCFAALRQIRKCSTTRPADTNLCFGCQQGRLLLLRAGRCLRLQHWTGCSPSSTLPPDSCSQPGALYASPRFSATFIGCGFQNGFNSVSAFWHSDVSMDQRRHISLESVCRTADVEGRRHLRSSTTMTLVVLSVQRLTPSDRAVPVAASRAWNSLPPAIRTVSSFTSFQQQLKTRLKTRLSFG